MQASDQVRMLLEFNEMLKQEHEEQSRIAKMNKEAQVANENALDNLYSINKDL